MTLMSPRDLHDAVRRHLTLRFAALSEEYGELARKRGHMRQRDDGWDYTPKALAIFPRYNVIEAIRIDVERLDPDALPRLPELTSAVERSIAGAEPPRAASGADPHPLAQKAEADERDRVQKWLSDWLRAPARTDPMPYRRVLRDEEAAMWWRRASERWGVLERRWHPLLGRVPEGVSVFPASSTRDDANVEAIRDVLRKAKRTRVIELREYGPEYELAVELFRPYYSGAEGTWLDDELDWIAYASHEDTIAFGGLLAR